MLLWLAIGFQKSRHRRCGRLTHTGIKANWKDRIQGLLKDLKLQFSSTKSMLPKGVGAWKCFKNFLAITLRVTLLYSLSKWTIIMLFIYVNLEEKPTINLCLKSMSCLLLFTSRARHYVNNGLMSGFLNYASYVRNARSCVAAKNETWRNRNMT